MALTRPLRAAVLGLALLAPATARGEAELHVVIWHDVGRDDGRGLLSANPSPTGRGSIAWRRCPPDAGDCIPVAGGSDRLLHVGDAPAGTVFEATATDGGRSASARSAPYLGPVSAVARPGLIGRLRVGALVRPTPARWTGGWGRERSFLQTQACRERAGSRCVVIADQYYWDRCPGAGAVLDPRYEGWWVRVIDHRLGEHPVFPAFGVITPEALRPIAPSRAAAATTLGPIGAADGPPESTCGRVEPWPVPRARLLRRARLTRTGALVGSVRCPGSCMVRLAARRRGWSAAKRFRSAPGGARRPLVLPRRGIARVRGRKVRVTVAVDGRRLAGASVALPRRR